MYRLLTTKEFDRQFKKLDPSVQKMVKRWIDKHLAGTSDPRLQGKGLTGSMKSLWRYRIGNYRLLVDIRDEELVIVAIDIDHRSRVYDRK